MIQNGIFFNIYIYIYNCILLLEIKWFWSGCFVPVEVKVWLRTKLKTVSLLLYKLCRLGCRFGSVAVRGCVNNCLLSLLIINDTISCWVVWQMCHAPIADCSAGIQLSLTELNSYRFSTSCEGNTLNSSLTVWYLTRLRLYVECAVYVCVCVCVFVGSMWNHRTQDVGFVVRNEGS